MFKAYQKFWKNYANFEGTSSRSDYWYVSLCHALLLIIAIPLFLFTSGGAESNNIVYWIMVIYIVVTIIPRLALTIRRLRDANFSWGYIFVRGIPIIGTILMIILLTTPTSSKHKIES